MVAPCSLFYTPQLLDDGRAVRAQAGSFDTQATVRLQGMAFSRFSPDLLEAPSQVPSTKKCP